MSFPIVRSFRLSALASMVVALLSVVLLSSVTTRVAAQPPAVDTTPQLTILIFERPADLARRSDPNSSDAYWNAYDAFAGALMKAGALRGGSALSETASVVVRGRGGADGAVSGARLGGYFVVAARDLTAARALAAQAPSFAVAVEVRPHRENPHMAKTMTPPVTR